MFWVFWLNDWQANLQKRVVTVTGDVGRFDEMVIVSDELPILNDEAKNFCQILFKRWRNVEKSLILWRMKRLFVTLLCCWLTAFCAWADDSIVSQLSHRRFTTLDGLPRMQAETVYQDSEGYIWIGTLSGFARYDGRTLTPFLKGRRENIVAMTETSEGVSALGFRRQWLVDGDNVTMRLIDPDQKWLTNGDANSQHMLLNNFNSPDLPKGVILLEDEQETHRMLVRLVEGGWTPMLNNDIFDLMTPDRKLYMDGDDIYVPTEKGLYAVRNKQARLLTEKDDFFTLTRMGDRLFALAGDGIYILNEGKLALFKAFSFEAPDYGLFVRQGLKGRLFIADSHNLYQFDGQDICKLATGFNLIKSLLVDRWGRLWMATYQGVYLFFHTSFTNHRLSDENDIVRALCIDGNGSIVMGTLNGKLLVNGKQRYSEVGQFFNPTATRMANTVYMVGNGDVAAVENGTLRWLNLPKDRYQFVAQASGRLIVGNRQGVLAYDPLRMCLDTLTQNLMHPWCAAEDKQGCLWVGSSAGLYRITGWQTGVAKDELVLTKVVSTMEPDSVGNIFFASADSLYLIRQGRVEELSPQLPMLAGHEIRTLHRSPRGFLLVAAIDGLLVAHIDDNAHIEGAQWFDHSNGFSVIEPMNTPMVEEEDGTVWLAGVEETTSFLPFRLLAFDPSTTIIEGTPPWWKRWWAWMTMALVAVLLSWWLAHLYEQRASRKALERLQREKRQKELQIKAVRLKAIPHFHANVMASIEYFLMNNSSEEASRYLKMYSDFTNQTLSDIDRPARSIEEEIDYIRLYLGLEQLRLGERLEYGITIDEEVDRNTLLPTMMLYTYCQNAVKHGIANKPEGGRIDIRIHKEDDNVVVEVTDNGVGRAEAARLNRNSTKQGLLLLKEQIDLCNQTNKRPIQQKVTDMYDECGHPAGTCYAMSVPVNYLYEGENNKDKS